MVPDRPRAEVLNSVGLVGLANGGFRFRSVVGVANGELMCFQVGVCSLPPLSLCFHVYLLIPLIHFLEASLVSLIAADSMHAHVLGAKIVVNDCLNIDKYERSLIL